MLAALDAPAPMSRKAQRTGTMEKSLRSKEASKFDEAIERCFTLLQELGPESPRFARVFQAQAAQTEALFQS